MNYVQPIRDKELFKTIQEDLKESNSRNYVLFMLGTHTGLRVSDILELKKEDIYKKEKIYLKEKKTNKNTEILIPTHLQEYLNQYCIDKKLKEDDYLLQSNKGSNQPITRVRAWQIVKGIGLKYGIDNLGTHSLRKTFGYHMYKKTNDIGLLMTLFNHAKESITLRYIGIVQDHMDEARKDFEIS